jgi:hypothetical protein
MESFHFGFPEKSRTRATRIDQSTFRAQDVRCSFCGRSSISSQRIVGGPGEGPNQVLICENCVALCAEILAETDP